MVDLNLAFKFTINNKKTLWANFLLIKRKDINKFLKKRAISYNDMLNCNNTSYLFVITSRKLI